jgi:hypothetical protein
VKMYKHELQKGSEKMKSVIAERNMFENTTQDYQTEVNKLKKENTELQMKYHELKLRMGKIVHKEETKRSMSRV